MLTESTGDVVLSGFNLRVEEHLFGVVIFDQLAQVEEGCLVGYPCRLLHIVSNDDDRILSFERVYQIFDLSR